MTGPPKLVDWLLRRSLPPGPAGDSIRGDLLEEFLASGNRPADRLRYTAHAVSIAFRYGLRRAPGTRHDATPHRRDAMETIREDLKFAARSLLKRPSFALMVIVTLALGIGAATAIFSIVDAILIRSLPYAQPERLVVFNETTPRGRMTLGWPNYVDFRDRATSFEAVAAYQGTAFTVLDGNRTQRLNGRFVSSGFLAVVGVQPQLGRMFTAAEDRLGAEPVAVISDRFWTEQLGADPAAIGRTLRTSEKTFTIIGVLPPRFQFGRGDDILAPIGPNAVPDSAFAGRGNHGNLYAVARLRPGVEREQAQAELKRIAADLAREYPNTNTGNGAELQMLRDRFVERVEPTLVVLMGAVSFLLLLACANVANLLVARGAARQHELAIRTALGSSRWRLVRHLLAESMLLSLGGAVLGVALAIWLVRTLVAMAPPDTPRLDQVAINRASLLFALAASAVCGLLFGAFPALQTTGSRGEHLLARASRTSAAVSPRRTRRVLMGVEVALALMLLSGCGLMIRTMMQLAAVDPGFRADHLLTARLTLSLPIEGSNWGSIFIVSGKPIPPRADLPSSAFVPVSDTYFRTMGIAIKKGRGFEPRDAAGSATVIVINETLAARMWPGEDPIGQRLKQGWPEDGTPWREVVGVVADVKLQGVDQNTPMQVFLPLTQETPRSIAIVARTAVDPGTLSKALESTVQALQPELPVMRILPMTSLMSTAVATRRLSAMILATFGIVAILIAAVGLYGVVSHSVTERTREIGLRMALGAERRMILRHFVGQGLMTAVTGMVVGIAGALGLSRWLRQILFGVEPTDPATLAVVATILLIVASVACYVPARRATRVDPLAALRAE